MGQQVGLNGGAALARPLAEALVGALEAGDARIARLTLEALRELARANAISRFVALGVDAVAPRSSRSPGGPAAEHELFAEVIGRKLPLAEARAIVVEAFERRYLEAVLADHGGVVTRAAEASGIARRHFQRLRARAR